MPPWWKRWPGRLEAELEAFADRGLRFELDEEEKARGRIVLRGRIAVDEEGDISLVVVYPDTFPSTRVGIFAPNLSLNRHQHPFGKNLCVLPRRSAYWRPSMLAADLVADVVPELIRLVREGGEQLLGAEDPQGEPFTDYLPYTPNGGVILPGPMLTLPRDVTEGGLSLRFREGSRWLEKALARNGIEKPAIGQALLSKVMDRQGRSLADADDALRAAFDGPSWSGRWVRLPAPPSRPDPDGIMGEIVAHHGRLTTRRFNNRATSSRHRVEVIGILFPEEVRQQEWQDAWIFLFIREPNRKGALTPARLVRGLRYTPADLSVRIPELAPLQERTAALVGLGTLGAPIASELVRSQLRTLRVLDSDYADPATAVRWPHGLEAAGVNKALFAAVALPNSHPYVSVEWYATHIGSTALDAGDGPTQSEELDQWIAGADLVIDATAEDNVNRTVAYLAQPLGIPQLYVWSIDGFGGVVARLIPGRTGCLLCLERALSEEHGGIPPPPAAAEGVRLRVQPRGCADPTFTAAGVDLVPLSIQAARLAFSTLCEGVPGAYPPSRDDVFVLSLRDPDGSLITPTWTGWKLLQDPECDLCQQVS